MRLNEHKNTSADHEFAASLRKSSPMAERLLWNALCDLRKETKLKFRKQQPLHPYVADFACMKARLIVELDGPSHDTRQAYDQKRDNDLQKMGWFVMRFTNEDAINSLEGVVMAVTAKARELLGENVDLNSSGTPPPLAPPARGGGR